ncbi:MAG TPA: crotonase/enoyl-CoA hydratase family protein [Ilumatobacter sp.]|nr:crotonase/enoyl-CoA hydratase family protein [Ilumatobacter sp.]
MSDRVLVSLSDGVAEVRFNRADKRNALDGDQFLAIADAGEQVKSMGGVRAVVLCGDGASFCAGLDFSVFAGMAGGEAGAESSSRPSGNPAAMVEGKITQLAQQVCWVWQEIEAPVIAAVQGHALGGGCQIALGADIRFSRPDTKWSVREVHWGLIPDMTGTFMLSRLVRSDIARELVYTAKVIDGNEAHAIGLTTHLADDPYAAAHALAGEIAGRSPQAVRGAKELFNRMFVQDAAEQFEAERQVIRTLIGTPNQVEAITANLENRPANFTD